VRGRLWGLARWCVGHGVCHPRLSVQMGGSGGGPAAPASSVSKERSQRDLSMEGALGLRIVRPVDASRADRSWLLSERLACQPIRGLRQGAFAVNLPDSRSAEKAEASVCSRLRAPLQQGR
jgi:hypothetical protein